MELGSVSNSTGIYWDLLGSTAHRCLKESWAKAFLSLPVTGSTGVTPSQCNSQFIGLHRHHIVWHPVTCSASKSEDRLSALALRSRRIRNSQKRGFFDKHGECPKPKACDHSQSIWVIWVFELVIEEWCPSWKPRCSQWFAFWTIRHEAGRNAAAAVAAA